MVFLLPGDCSLEPDQERDCYLPSGVACIAAMVIAARVKSTGYQ
ncbi:MAG TPA: hypothetical protein VMW77_04660 [Methanoregula sp.]|nr:hypothetical protein [Methanoregula sp.]